MEITEIYKKLSKYRKHYEKFIPIAGNESPNFSIPSFDFLAINREDSKIYFISKIKDTKVEYEANESLVEFWNELVNDLKVGNGIMGELLCEPTFDM